MYTSTNNSVCTAHISVNKNRVKVYENSVFLKDGQNFEIELYNPKQNSVLAKISINGRSISASGFVLKPGQRVFIERFIDEAKKFVFSTYEVSNTSQNRKAIENNGSVEVEFYDEYVPFSITTSGYWYNSNPTYVYTSSPSALNIGNNFGGTTVTSNAMFSSNTASFSTANCSTVNSSVAGSLATKSIETGRVEKGEASKQTFENFYGTFNSFPSSTQSIKILPASQKPVESMEVRNYCTNCGTRAKSSGWKFCPKCGNKL